MHPTGDEHGHLAYQLAIDHARQYLRQHPRLNHQRVDILSDAALGAAQAWASYDPARGTTLSTWLYWRVHGEILEGIRSRSPLTRSQTQAGLRPEDRPAQQHPVALSGLDDRIPAQRGPSDYDRVDDRDQLARLLNVLTPREAHVIRQVDLLGRTELAVSRDLGVTESRICQIRRQALRRMRLAADVPAAA